MESSAPQNCFESRLVASSDAANIAIFSCERLDYQIGGEIGTRLIFLTAYSNTYHKTLKGN